MAFPDGLERSEISCSGIMGLKYLERVPLEVLRIYPPVPLEVRQAAKHMLVNGQVIKKGTLIMLSPWAVNRSMKLWGEDAIRFKPDRSEVENGGASSSYCNITFLNGPRGCIGGLFARMELRCLLISLIGTSFVNVDVEHGGH